ncbi:MAG: hypothetical protein H0U98_10675 [Alphaproteobacteria bacterium]|nr:hypothetical protein [Alphaproteobacteria bacterium]
MNTSPKIKRHNPPKIETDLLGGHYIDSINDRGIAAELAMMTAEFTSLERFMDGVLAILIGTDDSELAGYVMRAIKSPKGRVDLMRNLLEKAPSNSGLSPDFDKAISEFWEINGKRNDYVHGQWYSHDSGAVFISIFDPHGWGLMSAREIKKEELSAMRNRIGAHSAFVLRTCVAEWQRRQPQAPSPQSPETAQGA